MFDNILIGVDGQQGGRDAIALARRLAAPEASLTLAHVLGRGLRAWWTRELGEELGFQPQAVMLAAEREAAGLDAGIICVEGPSPARGLRDLVASGAGDLVVVGSTRRARVARLLIGEESERPIGGATYAVAIAPQGYAERAGRVGHVGVTHDETPGSEEALAAARDVAQRHGARIDAVSVVSGTPKEELLRRSCELDLLFVARGAYEVLDGITVACPLVVLRANYVARKPAPNQARLLTNHGNGHGAFFAEPTDVGCLVRSDDDHMAINEHQTNGLRTEDRELVDLLASVLTDPTLHTDTRMRLHQQIAEILRGADDELHRAGGGQAPSRAPEEHGGHLPDLLASVLTDPTLHTDTRMRLHREISEILARLATSGQV